MVGTTVGPGITNAPITGITPAPDVTPGPLGEISTLPTQSTTWIGGELGTLGTLGTLPPLRCKFTNLVAVLVFRRSFSVLKHVRFGKYSTVD